MNKIKKNIILIIGITILLYGAFPTSVFSHPHVFVTNSLKFIFDDQGLSGIQIKWEFDDFFSSMLATDYDQNEDGKLDKEEVKTLKSDAFSNLAKFDYFTYIKINGKPFKVKFIKDFSAKLVKGKLYYSFIVPCHVKANLAEKQITVSQYDSSFYTCVDFAKENPVTLENSTKYKVNFHLTENKKESFYFDMLHPVEAVVNFGIAK